MSFLNPLFLFALLTVAIPLIIYLLNIRKPKRIRFSTLAFFDSLKNTALKRIRIKRWLLLAIRCLAILVLVFAVSRPFLPSGFGWENTSQPKVMGVLIDNSPSMQRVDRNGPYENQALEMAEQLLEMSNSDDRALLEVTNGASLNLPVLSPRNMISRLSDINILPAGNYTAERILEMSERLEQAQEPNKILYVITDGQETQFRKLLEEETEEKSNIAIQFLKIGEAEVVNVGFSNVEVAQANRVEGEGVRLLATVNNYSSQMASNLFLNVFVDGEMISQQPFSLEAEANQNFEVNLPGNESDATNTELVIEGDELTFDNRYFISLKIPEERSLLVVEEAESGGLFNSYLHPLLEVVAEENDQIGITFTNVEELEANQIPGFDAVILDGVKNIPDYLGQSLTDHVQTGAGLLLLPAAEGNLNSYNRILSVSGAGRYSNIQGSYGSFDPVDRMARPTGGHPVLESIFDKTDDEEIRLNAAEIFYYFEIDDAEAGRGVSILDTRTGAPLFREISAGNGRLIVSALGTDPGWSNFSVKPFFAPFYFRLIDYLVQGETATLQNHTLGETFSILVHENVESAEIIKNGVSVLPTTRQTFQGTEISYDTQEWTPGRATISAGDQSLLFSVNMDAMESSLISLSDTDVEEIFNPYFANINVPRIEQAGQNFMAELETASFGKEIWHWFIIIAIILLLLESIVSRLYKAETVL